MATDEYIFFGGQRIARRDPSSNVFYNFSDHLGTARSIAEVPSGQTTATKCYDADLYPFGGERWYTDSCDSHFKFTGKERDSESGLDNFGARYNSSSLGRFMSPDPILSTPLHIINPQRWNKYTYAVDNSTSYIDPDGRDAIAVNFSTQIPVVGHEGIISVHRPDGDATYARYGPEHKGAPVDKGEVSVYPLHTKVQFDQDGTPTGASIEAVVAEAAQEEHQDPSTVRINYFPTSEADTDALDNYFWNAKLFSDLGIGPPYVCLGANCADFTIGGLVVGGAVSPLNASQLSDIPNFLYLDLLADHKTISIPIVTHRILPPCGGTGQRPCPAAN
jgi:RHS repeat-associated protein